MGRLGQSPIGIRASAFAAVFELVAAGSVAVVVSGTRTRHIDDAVAIVGTAVVAAVGTRDGPILPTRNTSQSRPLRADCRHSNGARCVVD